MARRGGARRCKDSKIIAVRHSQAWLGPVGRGDAQHGVAWYGKGSKINSVRQASASRGEAWRDLVWRGLVRCGTVGRGAAWLDVVWCGKGSFTRNHHGGIYA
jgi:hypothetical protein